MDFDIVSERPSEGVFVIALSGEVDLYTAPEFKQQLIDAVADGAKHVVVDLTDTTFIDSTTLGVLVGGVRRLREKDGDLSLVCSDRNINKIFEITGLDQIFPIAASREEALTRLSSK
jgi:anti-sigma B factor antagonist